jgi:hypothetical protein
VCAKNRLVRQFASSAKDQLEDATFKYLSGDAKYKKLVLSAFKDDILYANYKMKVTTMQPKCSE